MKPRKQVHGNGVNTIQYTQAVHAMRTLLILVATFTCLVSFGSFVILYLLPTTSIWKDVNHIQVVTWDSWLLFGVLLLGGIASGIILLTQIKSKLLQQRTLLFAFVSVAAITALIDTLVHLIVVPEKFQVSLPDVMNVVLCIVYSANARWNKSALP